MLIVTARNIGGDPRENHAFYEVGVQVNTRRIFFAKVGPHDRTLGWPDLLRQIADAGETANV